MDDLLGDLRDSGVGAKIGNMFLRCLAYAGDFLLISPTKKCKVMQRCWDGTLNYCKTGTSVHMQSIDFIPCDALVHNSCTDSFSRLFV